MKILTILETIEADEDKLLGSGFFSSVYDHDSHTVVKIPNDLSAGFASGDKIWWEYCKNNANHNPFLPKVHETETSNRGIVGWDRDHSHNYAMIERLFKLSELDDSDLQRIIHQLIDVTHLPENYKQALTFKSKIQPFTAACEYLGKTLYEFPDSVKDDNLRAVIDFILECKKKDPHMLIDLHKPTNMLIRRGKTGIQLVISDPMA
jgi:hypothetical protein